MMEVHRTVRVAGDLVSAAENGASHPSSTYPSHLLGEDVYGLELQLVRQFADFRKILLDLDQLVEESVTEYGKMFKQRKSERNFIRLRGLILDMRVLQKRLESEYETGLRSLRIQGGLEDY